MTATTTHRHWCNDHFTYAPDVDADGFCRNRTLLHEIIVDIAEQFDDHGNEDDADWDHHGAPRIEVQSARDADALTPERARQLAALLMDKADSLEAELRLA